MFLGPDPEAVWPPLPLTGHLGTDLCVISPTLVFTRDMGPWGCRCGGRVAVGTGRPAPEPRPSGPCLRPVSASHVSPPFLGRISPQALPVLSFRPRVPVAALPQGLGHCHHLSAFHSAGMFAEPAPWPASRVQTRPQRGTVLGPRLCFSLRRHVTKGASLSVCPVRLTVEYGSCERPPTKLVLVPEALGGHPPRLTSAPQVTSVCLWGSRRRDRLRRASAARHRPLLPPAGPRRGRPPPHRLSAPGGLRSLAHTDVGWRGTGRWVPPGSRRRPGVSWCPLPGWAPSPARADLGLSPLRGRDVGPVALDRAALTFEASLCDVRLTVACLKTLGCGSVFYIRLAAVLCGPGF